MSGLEQYWRQDHHDNHDEHDRDDKEDESPSKGPFEPLPFTFDVGQRVVELLSGLIQAIKPVVEPIAISHRSDLSSRGRRAG